MHIIEEKSQCDFGRLIYYYYYDWFTYGFDTILMQIFRTGFCTWMHLNE